MKNSYLPDEALFTGHDEQEARNYIHNNNYTRNDVKLVRKDDIIQVITVREILWGKKDD